MITPPATERIEIIRSTQAFLAIEADWQRLWRAADGLAFQAHAWVNAWWATVAGRDSRELRIVTAWCGDDLVAVMPLAINRRRGLRVLEWAAKDYTDYADVLVATAYDPSVVMRMWDATAQAAGYDLVHLTRLLPSAHARDLVGVLPISGSRLAVNHRSETSLRVAGDWRDGAAWFDQQSKKTRQNYRRGCKSIEERGELQSRLLGPDEPLQPVLDRLAAMKRNWLAKNNLTSDLFDGEAVALRALVKVLADLGVLRAFVLECDGEIIAVSINFVQHGSMMAFLTSYDPEFERGSPGMVLMVDYIRWSLDRDIKTIDFLCGAEPFKQRFATESVTLTSAMGWRSLSGGVAVLVDGMTYVVKKMRGNRAPAADAAAH